MEDPNRKPAVAAGFRGGRYLSAQASAHGEWQSNGSAKPGLDAYATSKQCALVTAMSCAREPPRLHFNAVEPGFTSGTGLGMGNANAFVRALVAGLVPVIVPLPMPFMKILSTPRRWHARRNSRIASSLKRATYWRAFAGKALLPS
ncbi:hypothetical protein AB4851_03785 [Burkholderia sp. 22PA0099]|uniref:hypothetical protein n=1 Tax=Burkholderia sp. 22PA0099 TaxID=3237372 RepID=UPI0039C2C352